MTIYKLTQFERGMGNDFEQEWYFVNREKAQAVIDHHEQVSVGWKAIPASDFICGDDGEMWYRGENLKDDGKFCDMWWYYSRDIGFSITPITVQE